MAAPRYIVGIDLGTTNTVVAYVDTARPGDAQKHIEVLAIAQLVAPGEVETRPLLASLRYHPVQGELPEADITLPWESDELGPDVPPGIVGQLARELGAKVPGRLVASAKSWLCHPAVDRTAPILPWGAPADVPKTSPVGASASYLSHLADAWEHQFPEHPLAEQDVVLTVPASFDEAARALTVEAARRAGLPKLRLLEEPQAAFYDFLARHEADLAQSLDGVRLALVCDVGGGTTDLTLIQVELRESGPRLTRIAVGEHSMLGGDNMDLALAHLAEQRLMSGAASTQLGSARFAQLVQQCRNAKELLLSDGAPEKARVTVLGEGSRLVGGARSTELERAEVHASVLDGFFPMVGSDERPAKRRGGIVELGLPYVADPAVTRHVAAFLAAHSDAAREALGDRAPSLESGALLVPDAILLNGGVFNGAALARRIVEVVGAWRGSPLKVLDNDAPELAVARGAAAYGLARRGIGVRIGGGSARTYYAIVDAQPTPDATAGSTTPRRAVCVLPRGSEEGEEVTLTTRTFSLRLGRPVRFHLVSSSAERGHRAGDVIEVKPDAYSELPPIAAVLETDEPRAAAADKSHLNEKREIQVRLAAGLTEVGTLEMSCISEEQKHKRWKLEFQLRGDAGGDGAAYVVTQLHARFADATSRITRVYGKSAGDVETREVKTMRADLEKILGPRDEWSTPLLRELFGALWAGTKRRRRSTDHERVWFNLTGFALRPGFGYPLDEWRVKQLWSIFEEGVQFAPETQNWAEWWILWRRVAGGLDERAQARLADVLAWYLEPPGPRPKPRPAGVKMLAPDDMVRLVGSLERLPSARKEEIGGWLLERIAKHGERPQAWWAIGRLGARVPFYGSAHQVVHRDVAAAWIDRALGLDLRAIEPAAFAVAQLARACGDRERDLPAELRTKVAERLEASGAPAAWPAMVRAPLTLDAAEERKIFGESLPPGLRLLD